MKWKMGPILSLRINEDKKVVGNVPLSLHPQASANKKSGKKAVESMSTQAIRRHSHIFPGK